MLRASPSNEKNPRAPGLKGLAPRIRDTPAPGMVSGFGYPVGAMSRVTKTLAAMYRAMFGHFGHQDWWPSNAGADSREGKLEICVGAILTQNTNWTNVVKAIENLLRGGHLTVKALHGMAAPALAKLIRPAGYFNVKARRLKNFIAHVQNQSGGDIEAFLARPVSVLRADLLSINGVGPETADSIILYAAGKPTFVVDAYTRRILLRHGLIESGSDYEAVKHLFESSLPLDTALWNDYHAQLVAVGKYYCKPTARCEGCPLARFSHDPAAGR